MSCNHMYVTEADKALNMCGLCGVTFDEWREGKVSTFKDGVTAERERIIELLEGLEPWGELDTAFVPELIALIKGEK